MISILTHLCQDHVDVLAHLVRLAGDSGTDPGSRPRQVSDLTRLLDEHMHFEEKTLYPLLMLHVDASAMGARASAQHREIDALLASLGRGSGADETWSALVGALTEVMRRHFAEEEAMILPRLRRMMTDGMLRELASRYQAARADVVVGASLAR
ncbi:MAG: hemerythrin domain-containing protein [Planctomycetes bacterium]|nr:hemerythrin domain-containing protein [Planctomycetota bacterium]